MGQVDLSDLIIKIGTLCVHVSAKQSAKEVKVIKCHALKIKSTQIIFKQETFKYNLNIDNSRADKFKL